MIERNDFDDYLERKAKEQAERLETRQQAVYARQMQVEEKHLTNDPKWDKFLSHLQPLIHDAEEVVANCKENLFQPKLSSEGVMVMRLTGSYAQGRLDAFKEVMTLPKQLAAAADVEREQQALTSNNGQA